MLLRRIKARRQGVLVFLIIGLGLPLGVAARISWTGSGGISLYRDGGFPRLPDEAPGNDDRNLTRGTALKHLGVVDEPFAFLLAASTPRLQNATIEFTALGGVRLRSATTEFEALGGLRLRNATTEFECDPECPCPPGCDSTCDPECPAECDDCNLNGVYDGCDIDAGRSLDLNADDVPDECVEAAPTGVNWTDDIWDLFDQNPDYPYPDNDEGVPELHVTLAGVDLLLDDTVETETLRLFSGSALTVTHQPDGDLTLVDPGGVLNQGSMTIANDRIIDLSSGPLTLGAGGSYGPFVPGDPSASGSMVAGAITMLPGYYDIPGLAAPRLSVCGTMSVTSLRGFTMDGTGTFPPPPPPGTRAAVLRGGRTPPILGGCGPVLAGRVSSAAASEGSVSISGSMTLIECAEFWNYSLGNIEVEGDFDNQSLCVDRFDSVVGSLALTGETNGMVPHIELTTGAAVTASVQASIDLTSGTTGSFTPTPEPFNQTRTADVTVLSPTDLTLTELTLHQLFIGGASSAQVGARIYDQETTDLVASAGILVTADGSATVPIDAVLTSGKTYRIGFFIATDPPSQASATLFVPDSFPYTELLGLLDINTAPGTAHDRFPTQTFEVAGSDFGSSFEGFLTDSDDPYPDPYEIEVHTNFAMGTVDVAQARDVRFRNVHLNTAGTGDCQEALYVHNLTLRSDTTITLDNCRVYYTNLTQESDVTIRTIGCGELVALCDGNCDVEYCAGNPLCCPNAVCEAVENQCICPDDCGVPPSVEDGLCDDGLDNDCDQLTDCTDADCFDECCGNALCDPLEDQCNCSDDCGAPPSEETGLCADGINNDCDEFTDCDDSDCQPDSGCCLPSNAPVLEMINKSPMPPPGLPYDGGINRKNRYISVSLNTDPGRQQAIRVILGAKDKGRGNIPPPFGVWKGQEFWAGAPRAVCENAGQGWTVGPNPDVPGVTASPCGPSVGVYKNEQDYYWAAPLVCDSANAHFMDWGTLANYCNTPGPAALDGYSCSVDADCQNAGNPNGTCGVSDVVHLHHEGVVPSHLLAGAGPIDFEAVYAISAIDSSCPLDFEDGYSDPAQLHQAGWGDVVTNVATCPNWPPEESVGVISDVVALLNKFSNLRCAVQKTRADLVPCLVDASIGIPDVVASLGAFSGGDYEDTCGSGQCSTLGLCKGGPDHGTPCTNDDDCDSNPCWFGQ